MTELFTIGYERAAFDAVIDVLQGAEVDAVIDVRAVPHSRRREFARKHLQANFPAYGIDYEAWSVLGTPEAGRSAAKQGDLEGFARIFEAHLASAEVEAALAQLTERLQTQRCCLMCYERDPQQCHRTLIGERLKERVDDLVVVDLDPQRASNSAARPS